MRTALAEKRQPDLPVRIVHVEIDERYGLPGPERERSGHHRQHRERRDERGEHVRPAVATRSVRMLPPVIGRQHHRERGQQVRVTTGAEFDQRYARCRVGDEDMQEPAAARR